MKGLRRGILEFCGYAGVADFVRGFLVLTSFAPFLQRRGEECSGSNLSRSPCTSCLPAASGSDLNALQTRWHLVKIQAWIEQQNT